jgi:peptidoglycan/LPS O-acetylase OafA/YrhL
MLSRQPVFRQDIQGLRALAVLLVVVFHLYPSWLPGGYIGVDVFFVISGFLITSHLYKEIQQTGKINLLRFWARRIRRLLPAASIVLLVSAGLTFLFLPTYSIQDNLREIFASTIYMENWELYFKSVDYLNAETDPSIVRHYWSLSIEEQFYIAIPILLSLVLIFNKNAEKLKLLSIYGLLVFILLISFGFSIYHKEDGGQAYFSTLTRAWEFVCGGLLGVSVINRSGIKSNMILRTFASWAGIATILICAFTFNAETLFPGYIAIAPVLGTILIIASETEGLKGSFGFFAKNSLIQNMGDSSYSAYLWHWPLIVIAPFTFHRLLGEEASNVTILFLTFIIASISKIWIEDFFISRQHWIKRPAHSFGLAASSVGMIALASIVPIYSMTKSEQQSSISTQIEQFGSVQEIKDMVDETLKSNKWGTPDMPIGQKSYVHEWIIEKCNGVSPWQNKQMQKCVYGNPNATHTAVLIGDSWATHFIPAIRESLPYDWKLQILTLSQCPIADLRVHKWGKHKLFERCEKHRKAVFEWIETNRPSLIIASDSPVSTLSRLMSGKLNKRSIQEFKHGFILSYKHLKETGIKVVHLESPPSATCFFSKTPTPSSCQPRKGTKFQRAISKIKMNIASKLGFTVIDTGTWVCDDRLICPILVGNYLVKADGGHFTQNFSARLGQVLASYHYWE